MSWKKEEQTGKKSGILFGLPWIGEKERVRAPCAGHEKGQARKPVLFGLLGLHYFRLPRSFTVMTVARSAAPTVMSLETVISPLNMAATRAA